MSGEADIHRILKATLKSLEGERADDAMSALVFSVLLLANQSDVTLVEVHEAINTASEHLAKSGLGGTWA